LPEAHLVHAIAEMAEYLPTVQLEQTLAEAIEYEPAAHAPVTAERPVVEQNDPAVQAVHTLLPAAEAKVPVKQSEQIDDEEAE